MWQSILLRSPHWFQYTVFTQILQRRNVPHNLVWMLLIDIVEKFICLTNIAILFVFVEHSLESLNFHVSRYLLFIRNLLSIFLGFLFLLLFFVGSQKLLGMFGIKGIIFIEVLNSEHLINEFTIIIKITI